MKALAAAFFDAIASTAAVMAFLAALHWVLT